MTYPNFILLFLLCLCSGCSISKLQNQGSVDTLHFHSKIKFETYKSVIGFDLKINDEHRKFIFDTGANLSVVQRDSLIGNVSKYAGASKRKMKLGRELVPLIQIGNTRFVNTNALNGDFVGLKEQVPNFGGIIGQPIIQKANWLIDYPNKQLELASHNLADESFRAIEIIRKNGNSPYTFLEVNGEEYEVIIDLGSSSCINLPKESKLAKELAKSIKLTEHTRERYTLGGLQTIKEQRGIIPKVQLGAFEFQNVEVNINTSSQARLGMRFFKEYLIYIDNSESRDYKLKKVP